MPRDTDHRISDDDSAAMPSNSIPGSEDTAGPDHDAPTEFDPEENPESAINEPS